MVRHFPASPWSPRGMGRVASRPRAPLPPCLLLGLNLLGTCPFLWPTECTVTGPGPGPGTPSLARHVCGLYSAAWPVAEPPRGRARGGPEAAQPSPQHRTRSVHPLGSRPLCSGSPRAFRLPLRFDLRGPSEHAAKGPLGRKHRSKGLLTGVLTRPPLPPSPARELDGAGGAARTRSLPHPGQPRLVQGRTHTEVGGQGTLGRSRFCIFFIF